MLRISRPFPVLRILNGGNFYSMKQHESLLVTSAVLLLAIFIFGCGGNKPPSPEGVSTKRSDSIPRERIERSSPSPISHAASPDTSEAVYSGSGKKTPPPGGAQFEYVANSQSRIFHHRSENLRLLPNDDKREYFASYQAAIDAGYKPHSCAARARDKNRL